MPSVICGDDTRHKNSYSGFIKCIQPCSQHNRMIEFICLDKECQQRMLLCSQCILDHRNHSFDKVEKFLTPQKYDKIKFGDSKKHRHFADISEIVILKLNEIQKSITSRIESIKEGIQKANQRFNELGTKIDNPHGKVDNEMMLKIKRYLEQEWSYNRCEKMKLVFDKVLNAMEDSFQNLAEDMLEFIEDEDWQNIEETEYKEVEDKWFTHLHSHHQKVQEYFKFDADMKANNVKLIHQRLEAQYLRISPGTPFAVCDNYITKEHNKWKVFIKDCDSKMVFFNASTIYLGVCRPEVVKRMSFSHCNEGGRGTYMIGSNGWSYHHTDPALDRQDIVGFTFGKGDEISIEVDFSGRGKVRFRKLGKIYDNKFDLPLNLDERQLLKPCLKPCIGFSDEVGVTVRMIN